MSQYKKVLVALELNQKTDKVIMDKAKQVVAGQDIDMYLIHAVEHMSSYGAAYGVSAGIDVEEVLSQEADKGLAEVGAKYKIPTEKQIVKVGPAKFLILEEAEDLGVDLIVLGSHGRHGVRLLLGSTANAILHNAKCDVLAVRVYD